jgi:hypothetical protein
MGLVEKSMTGDTIPKNPVDLFLLLCESPVPKSSHGVMARPYTGCELEGEIKYGTA